tara:strand:- start:177205 stop:177312 length:108 start_codon:yes stop_codon:yes gene_type:complete
MVNDTIKKYDESNAPFKGHFFINKLTSRFLFKKMD